MNRRPRKMVPVVRNVRTMYTPIKAEKLSEAERIENLIDDVESDIYKTLGDSPLLETLESPKVKYLQKRLGDLLKKKENAARLKKNRQRHGGNKIRIDEVLE